MLICDVHVLVNLHALYTYLCMYVCVHTYSYIMYILLRMPTQIASYIVCVCMHAFVFKPGTHLRQAGIPGFLKVALSVMCVLWETLANPYFNSFDKQTFDQLL